MQRSIPARQGLLLFCVPWHFMFNIHPCDPESVKPSTKTPAFAHILTWVYSQGIWIHLFYSRRMNLPQGIAYFCDSLYFFSMFLAPFRAMEPRNPQFSHTNPSASRFPSFPQAEQIVPLPLELISTSSMPLIWHFCVNRSLTYP